MSVTQLSAVALLVMPFMTMEKSRRVTGIQCFVKKLRNQNNILFKPIRKKYRFIFITDIMVIPDKIMVGTEVVFIN